MSVFQTSAVTDSVGYKLAAKRNKYVECWGADKPFANINETALATNIGLAVSTYRRTYFENTLT